jgi:hypothetical protein
VAALNARRDMTTLTLHAMPTHVLKNKYQTFQLEPHACSRIPPTQTNQREGIVRTLGEAVQCQTDRDPCLHSSSGRGRHDGSRVGSVTKNPDRGDAGAHGTDDLRRVSHQSSWCRVKICASSPENDAYEHFQSLRAGCSYGATRASSNRRSSSESANSDLRGKKNPF